MNIENNSDPDRDPKQTAILNAAFEAFRLYGFRRTSMEDIAKGAGMSRAALYLHYRNKEDIFGSLVQYYYSQATQQVEIALAADRAPDQALVASFEAQTGPVFLAMINSPHGQELMDTKTAISAEIAKVGEARLLQIYTAWITREQAAGRIDLTTFGRPEEVANVILNAFYGVKTANIESGNFQVASTRLARMLGIALTA